MADAGIEGPQACPKSFRHDFGIAAVAAGVPLPTIAAALGHANLQTTAVYTTAAGLFPGSFVVLSSSIISRSEVRLFWRISFPSSSNATCIPTGTLGSIASSPTRY